MIVGCIAAAIVSVAVSVVMWRIDGSGEPGVGTWLFPALVVAGVLPVLLNAAIPQRVTVGPERIETVRWFFRQSLAWREVVEANSYSYGQDLFLRILGERSRILLSTRWFGWHPDDLRAIGRRIDEILDAAGVAVRRAGLSRDKGLGIRDK
jgi:hypothetical protein